MKICIVSFHYLETTFPLARHLADSDNEVEVYCVFPLMARGSHVIDYSDYPVRHGFDDRFDVFVFNPRLKEYLNKVKLYSFFYSDVKRKPVLNVYLAIRLAQVIKNKHFDVIHLIGSSHLMYFLHLLLGQKRIFHTMHEVTIHEENVTLPWHHRVLLNLICKRNVTLILHSSVAKNRFLNYYSELKGKKYPVDGRIFVIPFGLFETFNCLPESGRVAEERKTILFFGKIIPYKGLNYLIESVGILQKSIPDVKLIIAGNGRIEIDTSLHPNIELINKFVPNDELVRLIKRSRIVVCPYTSASQSGIPMVAFLFGKPVIATSVGGFQEIIGHMKTGLIVPPGDSSALARAIEKILTDDELLKTLKRNISARYKDPSLSWPGIAAMTLNAYCHKTVTGELS